MLCVGGCVCATANEVVDQLGVYTQQFVGVVWKILCQGAEREDEGTHSVLTDTD